MLIILISMVLNPQSQYYARLKKYLSEHYEDNMWAEDALFLERNSRDFVERIKRINMNAEAVCNLVRQHPQSVPPTKSSVPSHVNKFPS